MLSLHWLAGTQHNLLPEYMGRRLGMAAWYSNNNALVVRVPVRLSETSVCSFATTGRELLAKRVRGGGGGDIAVGGR